MVDFRKMISPKSRARSHARTQKFMDFADLSNQEMGAQLLDMTRTLRNCGAFSDDQRYSYDEWALYRVLPEIALRLNPDLELEACERASPEEKEDRPANVVGISNQELADHVSSMSSNASFMRARKGIGVEEDESSVIAEMMTCTYNYSLATIAMDRLERGRFANRPAHSEKSDLPGQYVLADFGMYDMVVAYTEDPDEAVKLAEQAYAELTDPDCETLQGERLTDCLYPSKPKRIMIQDFNGGESWQSEPLRPDAEIDKEDIALAL